MEECASSASEKSGKQIKQSQAGMFFTDSYIPFHKWVSRGYTFNISLGVRITVPPSVTYKISFFTTQTILHSHSSCHSCLLLFVNLCVHFIKFSICIENLTFFEVSEKVTLSNTATLPQ